MDSHITEKIYIKFSQFNEELRNASLKFSVLNQEVFYFFSIFFQIQQY